MSREAETQVKWFRARTLRKIEFRKLTIAAGVEVLVGEDANCEWGYYVSIPEYKRPLGFYEKSWFEIIEEYKPNR